VIRQPELLLNKVTKADDENYSLALFVPPRHIAKSLVGRI